MQPPGVEWKEYDILIHTGKEQPYIKILAYRNCVAVCTSEELSAKIQGLLQNKSRDEIFELPYVYGQTIHYVPGNDCLEGIVKPLAYNCEFLYEEELLRLQGMTGFENSLVFESNGSTQVKAVCVARDDGRIVGVAGATATFINDVWEVGVDVVEEYRNVGLGSYLVKGLTQKLLERDIVPFYSVSVTNIGSQMVAARCGYVPSWVDTYGTILDGSSAYDNIVCKLSL